jgi:hypothetical protein
MRTENVTISDLETIPRVDLENITSVRAHRIMRDDEGTVHDIEFENGGKVRISYTHAGKLRAFAGETVELTLTKQNVIVLRELVEDSELNTTEI